MESISQEKRTGQSTLLLKNTVPETKKVTVIIYILEIITTIGRYFPIIVLSLASLNVLMAANDFLANSIEFGIINSMFATMGFVSLIQMRQKNRVQPLFCEDLESNRSSSSGTRRRLR